MEIPYVYKGNSQGYDFSCDFKHDELKFPFERDKFREQAMAIMAKHGLSTRGYPYETWDENGLRTVHVGDGGRWVSSEDMGSHGGFSFHNIDGVVDALACAEVIVGGYLNNRGLSLPHIKKDGEKFSFDIHFDGSQKRMVQRTLKEIGEEHFRGFVERTCKEYGLKAEFDDKAILLHGSKAVERSDDGFMCQTPDRRVALASFHSLAYFVNYALPAK